MMMLHLLIHHSKHLVKKSLKKDFSPENLSLSVEQIKRIFGLIISYTLSLYFVKFLMLILIPIIYSNNNLTIITSSNDFTVMAHQKSEATKITPILSNHPNQFFRNLQEEEEYYSFEEIEEQTNRMLVFQSPEAFKKTNKVFIDDLFPLHVLYSNDFKTAFIIEFTGLRIFDISNMSNPKVIGSFAQSFNASSSAVLSPKKQSSIP